MGEHRDGLSRRDVLGFGCGRCRGNDLEDLVGEKIRKLRTVPAGFRRYGFERVGMEHSGIRLPLLHDELVHSVCDALRHLLGEHTPRRESEPSTSRPDDERILESSLHGFVRYLWTVVQEVD